MLPGPPSPSIGTRGDHPGFCRSRHETAHAILATLPAIPFIGAQWPPRWSPSLAPSNTALAPRLPINNLAKTSQPCTRYLAEPAKTTEHEDPDAYHSSASTCCLADARGDLPFPIPRGDTPPHAYPRSTEYCSHLVFERREQFLSKGDNKLHKLVFNVLFDGTKFEPEYHENCGNPDIDEKSPMSFEEMLQKVKPFVVAYEGI
ncbi:hydroxyproline-rich glycoprotein family protein [Zea mays]|uniref:Hydroxyproline-rich glycoprotein family protein n=1 Tax=Zea mays TaxID=4577 RepID=A0A1D6LZK7_MAIZE|nr:hydroxyproline-rich glycoprotein family protein [Zea mays]